MGDLPHRKALLQISLHGTRLTSLPSPLHSDSVVFDEVASVVSDVVVTVEFDSSVGSIFSSLEIPLTDFYGKLLEWSISRPLTLCQYEADAQNEDEEPHVCLFKKFVCDSGSRWLNGDPGALYYCVSGMTSFDSFIVRGSTIDASRSLRSNCLIVRAWHSSRLFFQNFAIWSRRLSGKFAAPQPIPNRREEQGKKKRGTFSKSIPRENGGAVA